MKHRLIEVGVSIIRHRYFKCVCQIVLFSSIFYLAFWVRTEGVDTIPDGQFYGNDAYLYYNQAQIISAEGGLPKRDMSRWLPIGRDNEQMLPLYSFVLAYAHKLIASFFPNVSLYQVTLYAPVVCFCLGLGVLCFFIYRTFGCFFSSIVAIFLATLFGTIARSVAGFSDRDSWCWLLGVLLVSIHLASLISHRRRNRWLFTCLSGVTMFLGGFSWEGFGVFLIIILFVEMWVFITNEADDGLAQYFVWVLIFVPALYLISPAYHSGYGFSKHLAALVLIPSLVLLGIRGIRFMLISYTPFAAKLQGHERTVSLCLVLTTLLGAVIYVLTQLNTFVYTAVPFSQTQLLASVGELQNPEHAVWVLRWGGVFVCGSLGFLITSTRYGNKRLLIPILLLFITTSLFRHPLETVFSTTIGKFLLPDAPTESIAQFSQTLNHVFFFTACVLCSIAFLIIAWHRKKPAKNELIFVAFVFWYLCWVALARDALRYDFFTSAAFAFFAAHFLTILTQIGSQKIRNSQYVTNKFRQHVPHAVLTTGATCTLLALLLFWAPFGGHAQHLLHIEQHRRTPSPGDTPTAAALNWIKTELSPDAVIAADWTMGNQLNVIGNVKTIADPDHFLQYWIHLYCRHVYCAQSEKEALEYLKTRKVTHLIITNDEAFYTGDIDALIGSDDTGDRAFKRTLLKILHTDDGIPWRLFEPKNTPFAYIETPFDIISPYLNATLLNGDIIQLPYIAYDPTQQKLSPPFTETADNPYGGVLLGYDGSGHLSNAAYLPPNSWNSLLVRLFMREDYSNAFIQVYPIEPQTNDTIKIWEIHYPHDIEKKDEYLNIEPKK